jgi:hypothetical protein
VMNFLYMTSHAQILSPPVTRREPFWFHVYYGSSSEGQNFPRF